RDFRKRRIPQVFTSLHGAKASKNVTAVFRSMTPRRSGGHHHPGVKPLPCLECPSHTGRVMRDAKAAAAIQKNDAAVSVDTLLEVAHSFSGNPLWEVARGDAVRSPFREHQLHNRLPPSGSGSSRTGVVGIAAAADQGGVAEPAGGFVEGAS